MIQNLYSAFDDVENEALLAVCLLLFMTIFMICLGLCACLVVASLFGFLCCILRSTGLCFFVFLFFSAKILGCFNCRQFSQIVSLNF